MALGFVSSHLPGSFPCTFLSSFLCVCNCFEAHLQSDSIPLCQGCLSLDPCGDLASLLPDWALSALPRALPGHSATLCRDAAAATVPFAE